MGTAIAMGIIIGVGTLFFIFLVYVVFSVIFSLFENIGKSEFTWYGILIFSSSGKLTPYDSFNDMVKGGVKTILRMSWLLIAMSLIVCIYVELNG